VLHTGLKLKPRPQEGVKVYTYSRDEGDFHASYIRRDHGVISFDFIYPEGSIRNISLGVPVEINIENAVAALAACYLSGTFDANSARDAISTFLGAERRFQKLYEGTGDDHRIIIDDYAHHPDELLASIKSVKELYPGRKLTVAFQPHLYTRTRDFADGFARALSLADEVVLLDIYPAREEPIPGVTSKIIFDRISIEKKQLIPLKDLISTIKNRNFDILLTAGAGNIGVEAPRLAAEIRNS
jgi:UDP-N-acetylmuramate--alanine ligase